MSHLDEGLLTELIDNELSEVERRSAEAHLAECGECRRVFEELRAFAVEADGLVAAVEVPAKTTARAVPVPVADQPRVGMHRWRTYAWAASVVLALGLGWAASDLRYAAPGRQDGLADQLKERAGSAPRTSDAVSNPAPAPALQTPPPAAANTAGPAQAPRDRAAGAPAEAMREEKAAAPVVAAEQAVRSDADRAAPSRPSSQPAVAAKLAQDAAPSLDLRGNAAFGNASVTAGAAPTAPPEGRGQEGQMARRAMAGFRQVGMEEAVRTLGGSIRLMDGLEARRILVGPGSQTGADPSLELVRVVYEDPPGRELWLDQQHPSTLEPMVGAAYAPLLGDTITTREGSGPLRVRWVDQRGFRLALTGYLATDSLRAMIHQVH